MSSAHTEKKIQGRFKTAAIYRREKGKIEERAEGRSQTTLRHQEDLCDKGKGMLKDNNKEYTLHLSSN